MFRLFTTLLIVILLLCMPMTAMASVSTSAGTTLNGAITDMGGYRYVDAYFQYGLTTEYGNKTPTQTMEQAGLFYYRLTGLLLKSTYHYRAVVVYGSTIHFCNDVEIRTPLNEFDTNADWSIDVLDLIKVSQLMGSSESSEVLVEDVNNDGSVDILDMLSIVREMQP